MTVLPALEENPLLTWPNTAAPESSLLTINESVGASGIALIIRTVETLIESVGVASSSSSESHAAIKNRRNVQVIARHKTFD